MSRFRFSRRGYRLRAPRLADFALFVEGASAELELELGGFCKLLNEEQTSIQAEAVLSDPVAEALARHFSREGAVELDVSARELLAVLRAAMPHEEWPGVGQLRGRLDRIAPGLKAVGLDVQMRMDGHAKIWRMRIKPTSDFQPVAVPPPQLSAKYPF